VDPLPPYARLLGLATREEEGELVIVLPFSDAVVGRPGFLHGGAIAGLLEFAAFSTLARAIDDSDVGMKPVTVTVDYMRAATRGGGDTRAAARVERLGQRIANVEAVAWQADRAKPVATARINFLLDRG
jgi:uncharacterized protein (TIGR00369 family)